nr:hypothetical protein [uncultured Blautia sp.]
MSGQECSSSENKKMTSQILIKCKVLGHEIRIWFHNTGQGINVLIEGGDSGHIGAVAVAGPGMATKVIAFPGHREDVLSKRWGEELAVKYNVPVVVEAGIHFNQITKKEIQEVLQALEKELERFPI